ncbi:TolB family protein [Paenibacillus oceani]|uniref:PD40 domain-containing protein n=1 Tax=Paenibacillus oceani TaxID=2772510 RepID=A0A927H3M3_9BACL|nr:PD40 domain-containing protein [Paenibacillus oceani]MBD2865639.1 PD40 domain-containing protein [Paenibacillus oceani]
MFIHSSYRDPITGTLIRTIGIQGSHVTHQYVSCMSWLTDNRHLVLCVDIDENLRGRFARFDTESGEGEIIDSLTWASGVVSRQNTFYYLQGDHRIYAANLVTGETFVVCSKPGVVFKEPLSVNDDGSRLGVYWCSGSGGDYTIGWVDTATGEVHAAVQPGFAEPYPVANHAQVNPAYSNLLFFAHEGSAHHIPDRIWSVDTGTGLSLNLYVQRSMPDGSLGEYVGHEVWSHDGEKLYFVNYPHSPLRTAGIYYASKDGAVSGLVSDAFPYWHVGVSPDGRWAAADTMPDRSRSKIVLIDLATGAAEVLCDIRCGDRHPGHPHPTFSPDGSKVTFAYMNDEGDIGVGIVDLGARNRQKAGAPY